MRLFFVFIIHVIFFKQVGACQNDVSPAERLPKYPLKKIISYCQRDSAKAWGETTYFYDDKKFLIKSVWNRFGRDISVSEYSYNQQGLLVRIYNYGLVDGDTIRPWKQLFIYNDKQQLVSDGYIKNSVYNNKGQLIKRTMTGNSWATELSYEYDSLGRKTISYRNDYPIIHYEYAKNLLIKETKHEKLWNHNKEFLYEYDAAGNLLNKKEDGKVIERYIYSDGKLIQQWINYYGIDPGFRKPCSGQDILKYEYY